MTRRSPTRRVLTVHPFAKINLSLRVGLAQADGFHDVRTLLQSIALSDTLTVTARSGPFRLVVDKPGVPADHTNLVWRAAAALWKAMGRRGQPRDVELALEKQIPAAAGLGGGSSDAAATLLALNRVWGARLRQPELSDLAARLGADVPFFLQGGTALGVGRGDEVYPVQDVTRLGVIVISPAFGVPTADAYRWLDEDRTETVMPTRGQRPRSDGIDVGWADRPISLTNDLRPAVARRFPQISAMIAACLQEGALGAEMSGSGSAVFGLFPLTDVRRAAVRLRRKASHAWTVLATSTLSRRQAARHLGL